MSTKDSYTAEEWAVVAAAPVVAGSYIAMADPGVTSLIGESSAMMKAMTAGEVPADASDLVASIVAGAKEMAEKKEKFKMPELSEEDKRNPAAAKAELLNQVSAATAAVAANGSEAEAAAYKQWIMSVATATAEAAREGGFMGIGGKRVSDQETAALAELSAAMGM